MMKACEDSGMLDELLNRPTGELWLFGSDGENEPDAGGDGKDDPEDEEEEDPEGDEESKSKKPAKKAPTSAEIAEMQRRIANFDEERDRDKGKIKKLNDSIKDKDAEIKRLTTEGVKDEDLKSQNTELESTNFKLVSDNEELRIQIAFLGDTTHKWANPAVAAKLLDRSNIEVDDKGRVTGLKAAADELAANNAYLLVQPKSEVDDDAEGENNRQPNTQRRTGDQPGQQRKGARSTQANDDRLRQRFSGLRH
jgi:hypothetical protein